MIIVTNWDKIDINDFCLTDEDWAKNNDIEDIEELRELARNGELFEAFEVEGETYALYSQMDSTQMFIEQDQTVRMICEGTVIGNKHQDAWKSD